MTETEYLCPVCETEGRTEEWKEEKWYYGKRRFCQHIKDKHPEWTRKKEHDE